MNVMNNFNFYNPTRILFGKDQIKNIGRYIPPNSKILITYGGGSVKKFATFNQVMDALLGYEIFEFGGIEANPQFNTLMKAVTLAKEKNIDFILAVGGGSVMDGTKFIALAMHYDGNPEDLLYDGKKVSQIATATPFGTVVTLPATGSEMNSGAVISHNHGKFVVGSPLVFPKFSVLDPTLTYSLPETQVANGIIDTFIHVTEQYVTYPVEARFQDRTAEGILQTLIEIGPLTLKNPTDYDLRANLVWCATMGLNGLIGAGVPQDWSTHMIGHELTAAFGIDHGKTLAIIQPASWRILKEQKYAKLLQFSERVWHIQAGTDDEKIDQAIEKTQAFFESLGVKTHLSDYSLTHSDIDLLINALEKHGLTALSESRAVNLDVSRKILEAAF